jgi:hypothetical protein
MSEAAKAAAGASVYDSVGHGDDGLIFGAVNPSKLIPSAILFSYRLKIDQHAFGLPQL